MALIVIGKAESGLLEAVASQLYTTGQAANYLGISRQALYDESKAGKLRKIFPHGGRTGFYFRQDLDDYKRRRRRGQPPRPVFSPDG